MDKQSDHQNPYRFIDVELEDHPVCGKIPKVTYPVDNEDVILNATQVKSSGIIPEPMTDEEEEALEISIRNSYWNRDKPVWHGFDIAVEANDETTYLLKKGEKVICGDKLDFHTIRCPQKEAARKQLKIDTVRLKQAAAEAINSNCQKHMVGCIITDVHGKILSSGYNGSPPGHENCCDRFPDYDKVFGGDCEVEPEHLEKMVLEHREWSMLHEIHAEVNAIMHSNPSERAGGTLYVNLQPCENCAKMIAGSGVSRVVYGKAYHRANNDVSEQIFADSNIQYIHLGDDIIKFI